MTESEWLVATDWRRMKPKIKVSKTVEPRKVRLFAVACCRRIAHLFEDARTDEVLELAEQFADGHVTRKRLDKAEGAALKAIREAVSQYGPNALAWARDAPWRAARDTAVYEGAESCLRALAPNTKDELRAQTALFREVFGNPYHRVRCDPAWLTTDVVALARGIYDERAFDRMPILADALQDAGCDSDLILNHCRDTAFLLGEPPAGSPKAPPVTHVRGCWVVDLLLKGK